MSPDAIWFQVQQTEDPDCRAYHSRLKLLDDHGYQSFIRNSEDSAHFDVSGLVELAMKIPGITAVTLRAYVLIVSKSPVFEWDEIDQELLRIFMGIRQALTIEGQDEHAKYRDIIAQEAPVCSTHLRPVVADLVDAASWTPTVAMCQECCESYKVNDEWHLQYRLFI